MIDLYYWTTPNGHKITIFLEECGLEYQIKPVNIARGDQFAPDFLKISPNNKIPAIVDHQPADNGEPLALFESGEILLYLAEKSHRFLPLAPRQRHRCLQWLFWQMGGFGPMLGQNHHFSQYAPEKIPYAIERYQKESARLYGVLDDQLALHSYVAGDYSIADMAIYPWVVSHAKQGIDLAEFPHVGRWYTEIKARPAVIEAYRKAEAINSERTVDEQSRAILFGQGRRPKTD
jgi:GST-like protein